MAKDKTFVFVLIVIAILVANSAGYINLGGLLAAAPGPATAEADQTGTLCLHDGSTMTIGPSRRRYSPTTSVANEYARVYVDGVDRGLKVDATTMEVTTPTRIGGTDGSAVEIYYSENSSNHYAAKQAFSVPCTSAFSSGARPDSDAYLLVANASNLTVGMTVFNDDDGLKNSDTNNETMGADDSANFDIKINWPSKSGYSPYGNVILTASYNSTTMDKLELTSNDVTVTDTTTPVIRVSTSTATGKIMKSWKFPGYDSLTTTVQHFNLYVETTSTNPTGTSNITIWLDDEDWYRNGDTGKMEFGAETEANANVGQTMALAPREQIRIA